MKLSGKKMWEKKTSTVSFFILFIPVFLSTISANVPRSTYFQGKNRLNWNLGPIAISVNGSYRLRGELQNEFNIKNFATGRIEDFLLSRLRLEADFQLNQQGRLHFQCQDARVFGSSFTDNNFISGNNPFHDPLDINQGYMEVHPFDWLKIKIGRQAISFRDRRIFGPGDWGNTGRYAWDAVNITLKNGWIESNLITGRFIQHDPNRWPNKWVNGPTAYAIYNSVNQLPFVLDIFYVLKYDDRNITIGEAGAGNLVSHSPGFWLLAKWQSWEYSLTAVGQLGKWGSDDIRTYGLVGSLAYQWSVSWKPLLKLQCIIGSGDQDPGDGIHGTFDGVYGGADTDLYGWMNLFFWQNLREYRVDVKISPTEAVNIKSEYHYFILDQARDAWYFPGSIQRQDKTGSSGKELGKEIDTVIQVNVTDYMTLLAGWCLFIPGKFVKCTGRAPVACWYFFETDFYF